MGISYRSQFFMDSLWICGFWVEGFVEVFIEQILSAIMQFYVSTLYVSEANKVVLQMDSALLHTPSHRDRNAV